MVVKLLMAGTMFKDSLRVVEYNNTTANSRKNKLGLKKHGNL